MRDIYDFSFIFIIVIILLHQVKLEKNSLMIFRIDYLLSSGFFTSIYIDKFSFKVYEKISQQMTASYLNVNEIKEISVFEIDEIIIDSKSYQRGLLIEDLRIGNLTTQVSFYGVPKMDFQKNAISFPLHPKNELFSIVHQLKKSNQIEKMKYTFVPDGDGDISGKMYIGNLQSSFFDKDKSKGECRVTGESWGCNLQLVYFMDSLSNKYKKNRYFINNEYALFDCNILGIEVPFIFLEFITNNLLNDLFNNNQCWFTGKKRHIQCEELSKLKKFLPKWINFVFDNQAYAIEMKSIIGKDYEDPRKSALYIFENADNKWIFGGLFLRNFVSSFDYEDKMIMLYSNFTVREINVEKERIYTSYLGYKYNILYVFLFELILGIFWLVTTMKMYQLFKLPFLSFN